MRKKNYKGAKCTKRYVNKCDDVCKTYDAIQYAYANLLSEAEEVKSFQVNVLLQGLEEGAYTSDFVITKANGKLMVRECVSRKHLTSLVDAIGLGIRKLYTEKKAMVDFETIKKESGLKELDWNAVWESVSKYPAEVQTVLEAKNEDHVKLYDQDKQEIWKIQDETKQLLRDEVPELFWIDFFKTIQLYNCEPMQVIFEAKKSKEIKMDYLLYDIHDFLYGGESNRDIQLDTQIIFNNFENLIDETDKNVRITQIEIIKGKNISTVIGEILAAVSDEYHGKCYEKSYCTFNDEGIGILYTPDENILDKMSIKELIAYLNEDRYCDDKFVEVMRSYGYEIKTGEHPDIGEALYIDVSKYIKDAKVWLQEANRQHTIYRRIDRRSRLDVLYLLHIIKFENIWSDEI